MYDPNTMTVSEVVTIVRNVGILGTILVAGWKARALVQPIVDFFDDLKKLMKRATRHMDIMEESMGLLLDNHLAHIGENVSKVAHHQVRASLLEQASYAESEAAAPEAVAESPTDGQDLQV